MQADRETTYSEQVRSHERFEFGENWARFLRNLDPSQITAAEESLIQMLEAQTLEGKRFLDAGSGSGLFSLAARRLKARVHSFDFDPHSVACTMELRRRYFPSDPDWTVEEASVLDVEYLQKLGQFDIVYSWGVLHHTGSMWAALENIHKLVSHQGKLFIAIYNDQGTRSRRWLLAKRFYNRLPRPLKAPWAALAMAPTEMKAALSALVGGGWGKYWSRWTAVKQRRGMNHWRNIIDWVGGYPYEFASADEIFSFFRARGFALDVLVCKGTGLGCVEYVFRKVNGGGWNSNS